MGISQPGGGGAVTKAQRVTTGSIAGAATAAITITWASPFADANYSVSAALVEATATTATIRIHHVESISAANVVVRVVNDDAVVAKTGTLHVVAIHD